MVGFYIYLLENVEKFITLRNPFFIGLPSWALKDFGLGVTQNDGQHTAYALHVSRFINPKAILIKKTFAYKVLVV